MQRILGASLVVLWLVFKPITAFAIGYGDNITVWGSSFDFGHMLISGAAMFMLWVAVFMLFSAMHRLSGAGTRRLQRTTGSDPVMRNLVEKYVRGEIDHDEFVKRRQTLLQMAEAN